MSRLSPLPPDQLSAESRKLHDDMRAAIAENLQGFVSERSDGALLGPFAPMLNFPQWGGPAWAFTRSLMDHTSLPKGAHEVAILTTGAANRARYELYSHEHVAANTELSRDTIAAVVAGQRPSELTSEQAAAYDVAAALAHGGSLPGATYQRAVDTFGETATAELVFLVGCYNLVSTLLNAYDVDVPGADESTGPA